MLKFLRTVVIGTTCALGMSAAGATPINGDFELGPLTPWTAFTTANGSLGASGAQLRQFDVDGDGQMSTAFAMSTGYAVAPCSFPGVFCPLPVEGGGIRQSSSYAGGKTTFHADIAVHNTDLYGGYNGQGGYFTMSLDGILMASFSVNRIDAGQTLRSALDFTTTLSAGMHTLEIATVRGYSPSSSLTQLIDNVSVSEVPEPASVALFGLAGLMLFGARRAVKHRG